MVQLTWRGQANSDKGGQTWAEVLICGQYALGGIDILAMSSVYNTFIKVSKEDCLHDLWLLKDRDTIGMEIVT